MLEESRRIALKGWSKGEKNQSAGRYKTNWPPDFFFLENLLLDSDTTLKSKERKKNKIW